MATDRRPHGFTLHQAYDMYLVLASYSLIKDKVKVTLICPKYSMLKNWVLIEKHQKQSAKGAYNADGKRNHLISDKQGQIKLQDIRSKGYQKTKKEIECNFIKWSSMFKMKHLSGQDNDQCLPDT